MQIVLLALLILSTSPLRAADTSIAIFRISGSVPTFFSVTARGMPGDLDLTPNVQVRDRLIGLMHFKYNANIATLTIASNTTSGFPEDSGGGAYSFGAGSFKVAVGAGCQSVDTTYNTPFALTNAGTDIKSVFSTALTQGLEEDCELRASWDGTTAAFPLAGIYSLSITVTMVSN